MGDEGSPKLKHLATKINVCDVVEEHAEEFHSSGGQSQRASIQELNGIFV